jgi:orotidine-5'-phosphate decarboxylase
MERQDEIMTALQKFYARTTAANSLLCVGLDSDRNRLPQQFRDHAEAQFEFNRFIIEQTAPYVAAYKPNIAFYEAYGIQGLRELGKTLDFLRANYPDILTICDAKRGDIGSTSEAYARSIFDEMGFDAVTLNPYLGKDALDPFLQRSDKISIILCRTSNEGAGEFQDLTMEGKPLWQRVAERVRDEWNTNENCMLVVGATYPGEMKIVREIVGDMTLLVPGIGVQGGNIHDTVNAGKNSQGAGLIINSSRGIIFSNDPASAARELQEAINIYR